jgi:hypothetical protein
MFIARRSRWCYMMPIDWCMHWTTVAKPSHNK